MKKNQKLSLLMSDYLDEQLPSATKKVSEYAEYIGSLVTEASSMPISPKKILWSVDENTGELTRVFKFGQHEQYITFASDVLEFEAGFKHYADISMRYPTIEIRLITRERVTITDMDIEYSRVVSSIFEEVMSNE